MIPCPVRYIKQFPLLLGEARRSAPGTWGARGADAGRVREFGWILFVLFSSPVALSAADFLNMGVGARAVALGEAYVSLANGPESLQWNPAGLAEDAVPRVLLQGAPQAKGGHVNDLGLAWPVGKGTGMGASIRFAGAGEVTQTDEFGNDLGTFDPHALAVSVGLAQNMAGSATEGAAWGVAGRYVRATLLETADTMGYTAGVLSPAVASGRGRAGVSYTGGGRLRYDQQSDPLPSLWRAGASFKINDFWLVSTDGGFPRTEQPFLGIGTEFRLPTSGGATFFERAGYNTRWRDQTSGPSGLSFGLGVHWGRATLDYAFRLQGGWDAHVLSLSMAWGSPGRSSEVRGLLRNGHRLLSQNRPYEAILKFNEALAIDPANEEAKRGIRSAAEALKATP